MKERGRETSASAQRGVTPVASPSSPTETDLLPPPPSLEKREIERARRRRALTMFKDSSGSERAWTRRGARCCRGAAEAYVHSGARATRPCPVPSPVPLFEERKLLGIPGGRLARAPSLLGARRVHFSLSASLTVTSVPTNWCGGVLLSSGERRR